MDAGLRALVDIAVADLAARLQIDDARVTVVSAVPKVWPDRSLGCPRPGMVYAQVLVDGAFIELSVDGAAYRYHSGGTRGPFLCQGGKA